MVKKITKYLKFVVCCALIMSLVAPSYAALSASDGSAFVTKAEFDAALADFNSRLTTFEAGINSKIDSQVTSYLDRNGIWNGKDQIIKSNAEFYTVTTASALTTSNWGTGLNYRDIMVVDVCIVDNITKSGLVYASMQCGITNAFDPSTHSPLYSGPGYIRWSTGGGQSREGALLLWGFYISRHDSGFITGVQAADVDGFALVPVGTKIRDAGSPDNYYFSVPSHRLNVVGYNFVSAGDRLYMFGRVSGIYNKLDSPQGNFFSYAKKVSVY